MLIDVHVHVFPPEVTKNIERYIKKEEFLRAICTSRGHKYATAEDVLEEMQKSGVDKTIICGFASSDEGLNREMNDYVLEVTKKYPDRLMAWAVVSPHSSSMEREIARCHELGAVGVGELFPWGQKFPLEGKEAGRLAGICQERKIPLLLHVNENVGHDYTGKGDISVKEAADYATRFPELTIVYAHWGGGLPFFELMPEIKKSMRNVDYDTAAGPFLYRKDIYRVAREADILPKILLGTDYPLITQRRYLRELRESGLTEEEINMVAGENAAKLFV